MPYCIIHRISSVSPSIEYERDSYLITEGAAITFNNTSLDGITAPEVDLLIVLNVEETEPGDISERL